VVVDIGVRRDNAELAEAAYDLIALPGEIATRQEKTQGFRIKTAKVSAGKCPRTTLGRR
jgi:hypothetical protein